MQIQGNTFLVTSVVRVWSVEDQDRQRFVQLGKYAAYWVASADFPLTPDSPTG